ncbi:hypothetical protein ACPWT1_11860 [Ramlibacter sp. MMS24-I3-19]|uniref:hypothetical protein n=1 Tax=Ramlibacter sp. MMS24-I3-19 TaxID=3416606 RepID=UPI003D030471
MQSRRTSTGRQRLALVAFTSLWLSACGGGGGGGAAGGGADQAAAATGTQSATASSPAPSPSTGAPAVATAPSAAGGPTASPPATQTQPPAGPTITVQGTDGPDTLEATSHPAVMAGGKGDDIYVVTDPADEVIEEADGGVDEIRTSVGYTLPANVENMSVSTSSLLGGGNALVGNALDNRITGAAFTKADIYGMEGDDILDAGGRYGAYLDGGPGNDTLINNIGESRGGPGADTFVVRARGAMTAPDVPLTILDFTPAEGDRIDGSFLGGGDPATLFATGNLQFDAANHRLVYTRNPAAFATTPTAVDQIILLPGVTSFDPAWIIRR